MGEDLAPLQQRLACKRLLVRLFSLVGETWILEGGYALELRLGGKARATQDLAFNAPAGVDLLDALQEAAEQSRAISSAFSYSRLTGADSPAPRGE